LEQITEKIIDLTAHVDNGMGGNELVENFLQQNGISGLSEQQIAGLWDGVAPDGSAVDIFTGDAGAVDTYDMGAHAGLNKPGDFTLDAGVAQRWIDAAKSMPGVVIK